MQDIEFIINTEYVELCNLLKLVDLADSGGRGKAMVAEGLVKVDGELELRKTAKIKPGQIIECEGKRIVICIDPNAEIKPPKVKAPKVRGKGQPNRRSGAGIKPTGTKSTKKTSKMKSGLDAEKKSPWH
jgi:ribosome-associated protein